MQSEAKLAIEQFRQCLRDYALQRNPELLVGIFFDHQGIAHHQNGIYGVSSWITLTEDEEIRNDEQVRTLRLACEKKLQEWVRNSLRMDSNLGSYDNDSSEYEIRSVLSKTCDAFEALNSLDQSATESQQLKLYVSSSQISTDGSWGFVHGSTEGDPIMTSLVIRTFANENDLKPRLKRAIEYLQIKVSKINNLYEKLFVLNTINLFTPPDNSMRHEMKKLLKETMKGLYRQIKANPTRFPNPINVDFNDGKRTRYFRLPADLIVIESLCILSGKHLLYLHSHIGKRAFRHLAKNFAGPRFDRDTSGHRAAANFYKYAYKVMKTIRERETSWLPFPIRTALAWFITSWSFGEAFSINFVLLILAFLTLAISISISFEQGAAISYGVIVKLFIDIVRTTYNLNRARIYE